MIHAHENKMYVSVHPEHAIYLLENCRIKVVAVYKHYLNREMEVLNEHNYIQICRNILRCYEEMKSTEAEVFMVFDVPDLKIEINTNSYHQLSVRIDSSDKHTNNLRFGSVDKK